MRTAYLLVLRRPTLRLLSSTLPPHTFTPPHTAALRWCVFSASHNKMFVNKFLTFKKCKILKSAQLSHQGSENNSFSLYNICISRNVEENLFRHMDVFNVSQFICMTGESKTYFWRLLFFFLWLWSNFFLEATAENSAMRVRDISPHPNFKWQ